MRRAFTLLEIICAVVLIGVVTTLAVATSNAVSRGWEISTDYIDKMQRTDYALNQLVSALRSMYYPSLGQQSYDYGFVLTDNGDGEDPDRSDVLEWSRLASVGSKDKSASTVHRIQVMVLEEGNRDFDRHVIERTGLYMRRRPDVALSPKDDADEEYGFDNSELYEPVLIADGIVGFNCRVLKEPPTSSGTAAAYEKDDFEDKWDSSNSVPYKVELTFHLADPDGKSYRSNTAPVMRIVRIPIYEQSQDGAVVPTEEGAGASARRRGQGGQTTGPNGGTTSGPGGGAASGPGVGNRAPGMTTGGGARPGAAPGGGAGAPPGRGPGPAGGGGGPMR